MHGDHPSQTFSGQQPATTYPGGPVPGGEYGARDPFTGPGITQTSGHRVGDHTFTQPGIAHTQEGRHVGATGAQGGIAQTMGVRTDRTTGGMLGSEPLKAHAYQKERLVSFPLPARAHISQRTFHSEAGAVRVQQRELAEAEHLEEEAVKKRQQAVAHGADPANARLGAGASGDLGY